MALFNTLVTRTIMHVPAPIVGHFARGYIAGNALEDAVAVTRNLNREGMLSTIDILGECIAHMEQARFFREECLKILAAIHTEGLKANLSLKPTQLGLSLDKEECLVNLEAIVAEAARLDSFVRIDMEDHSCTDDTLLLYQRLRAVYPGRVGTVLQSCLRRTSADIEALADAPLNLRLCKGIYIEPRLHAYRDPAVINRSFVHCLEKLFQKKAYVGIATHDEHLVFEALRLIEQYGMHHDEYEFQMLLGVDEELRRIIVAGGHRLRIYVPYGKDWLPYARRRLKENPNIARHAIYQMLGSH